MPVASKKNSQDGRGPVSRQAELDMTTTVCRLCHGQRLYRGNRNNRSESAAKLVKRKNKPPCGSGKSKRTAESIDRFISKDIHIRENSQGKRAVV